MAIHEKHIEWLAARGIQSATAEAMEISTVSDERGNWLQFPYRLRGVVVNRKRRMTAEKRHEMDKGGKLCLWNEQALRLPHVVEGKGSVIITEGEFDALVAIQCGFEAAVSVPNGAPAEAIDDPVNSNRYRFLWESQASLEQVSSFILATDGDAPGVALAHDLASILGPERCKFLVYPEKCKDLNDVLVNYGPERVSQVLTVAKPFPVRGLYRMSDFPEAAPLRGMATGIDCLDPMMQIVLGTLTVVSGYSNSGKALAIDTPIATPSGWSTMGDLRVGDFVFTQDGKPCKVVAATEVQHDRPCYRMQFRGGEEIVADAEHLWLTDTISSRMSTRNKRIRGDGPIKPKGTDQKHKMVLRSIKTSAEIAATIITDRLNHSIPPAGVLDLPEADLPLDPYLLGVWLGDGATNQGVITSADPEIPKHFADAGFPVKSTGMRHNVRCLVAKLREVGVFGNKHVPVIYTRSSARQRLALFQGLMDTDGHCEPDGACEFVSTKETLALNTFDLACSLGIKASLYHGRAMLNGKDCGPKFRVSFKTNLPVFRLARKLERLPKKPPSRPHRMIISCEPVSSVPVRCIQVSHPSGMFLAGRAMIPTHNSTLLDTMLAHCVNRAVPVCVASFETQAKPILFDGIARAMIGCTQSAFAGHPDLPAAYLAIEKHVGVISNSLDEELEFDIESFLDTARVSVVRDGAKVVLLDPWNEIEHKRGRNETLTEYVGRAIRLIKNFVRRYNVAFIIVAHPSKPIKGTNTMPSLYDISDSAHFSNKADYGLIYHRPDKAENLAQLAVVKVRKGLPGEQGVVDVKFDHRTGRIVGFTE